MNEIHVGERTPWPVRSTIFAATGSDVVYSTQHPSTTQLLKQSRLLNITLCLLERHLRRFIWSLMGDRGHAGSPPSVLLADTSSATPPPTANSIVHIALLTDGVEHAPVPEAVWKQLLYRSHSTLDYLRCLSLCSFFRNRSSCLVSRSLAQRT